MRNTLKKFKTSTVALICLGIVTLCMGTVYALNSWSTGYQVNNGASANVYVAGTANYRRVTNTSGSNVFVPSKTTAEMNSYCASSGAACYTCTEGGWGAELRGNIVDHDTGSSGHTQDWCESWCRGILDGVKDTGQHVCVRRSSGRCHLYRDDTVGWGIEAGRTYKVLTCANS